jgi:hypothetical protein
MSLSSRKARTGRLPHTLFNSIIFQNRITNYLLDHIPYHIS